MNQQKVEREELPAIALGYKNAGWSSEKIAVQTGYSDRTVRRALQEAGYVSVYQKAIFPPDTEISKRHYKVLEELHIKNRDVAICSDIHIPATRYDWLDNFIRQAVDFGIKDCIIAGDLFDQSALNRHEKEVGEARDLQDELSEGSRLIRLMLEKFDHIYILRGNHDVNYARNLGWVTSFAYSMRMMLHDLDEDEHERITIVDSDNCYVHNSQGKWLVAHTYQFSKRSGTVPSDLAMIHKDCVGVIGAHRHHYGIVNVPNGSLAIEAGHFSDSTKLQFMKKFTRTFGKSAKGGGVFIFKENPYLPLATPLPPRIMDVWETANEKTEEDHKA